MSEEVRPRRPDTGPATPVARDGEVDFSSRKTRCEGEAVPSSSPTAAEKRRWTKKQLQQNQSIALTILATLAVLGALYVARAILLPVSLAVLYALTLRPVVRAMARFRVPNWAAAAFILFATCSVLALGVLGLVQPAQLWISDARERMEVVGDKLSVVRERVDEVYAVSEEIEELASDDESATQTPEETASAPNDDLAAAANELVGDEAIKRDDEDSPVEVQVTQPRLMTNLMVINSAGNYLGFIGVTLVLGFFLLAQGDLLLNNVLHVLPALSDKMTAVRLVHDIEEGISRYLLTVATINLCLGIAVAFAMWQLKVPNPVLWGLMATLLNFIPYLGAMVGVGVIFLVAVFSFDSLAYAAFVPFVYFVLTSLEGNFITPHFVGRTAKLNAVAVVLALVFWGWMWGVAGALIGVPMLIVFKIACDHFERMRAVGILLEGPETEPK